MSQSDNSRQNFNAIQRTIPPGWVRRLLWLLDSVRSMGIYIQAGRGSGKSRLMGRGIGWQDFVRGTPLLILDPTGSTVDNFLDKLTRLPEVEREELATRVIYVDMSGKGGQVVPFPLYYRLGEESLYEISQRVLDTIRMADPALLSASVEGFNAIWKIGTYAGMVLCALGYQITEAKSLLAQPEEWRGRFAQAVQNFPEAQGAVDFFTNEYMTWKPEMRARQTASFLNKIAIFSLDPSMKAMFGAQEPAINWQEVVEKGYAVLLDFRRELDVERRRFKMLWIYNYFVEYIKHRGPGHGSKPVSFIIDELSALLNFSSAGSDVFSVQLDELINVISRNHNLWMTVCHQELFQIPPRLQKTLLTLGTQLFGSSSDADAALLLARNLFKIDPYKVKRYDPIYGSNGIGFPQVIDERPVEFSIEEQHYLKSYRLKNQRKFHFLVRPALEEGSVHGPLYPITIENLDRDIWVDEKTVELARSILRRKSGLPIAGILAEIHERNGPDWRGTMKEYGTNHTPLPPTIPAEEESEPPLKPQEAQEEEDYPDDDELFGDKKS